MDGIRVVHPADLDDAVAEMEAAEIHPEMDGRVPFTQDEVDAMTVDPCYFGYHRFTPTAAEMEAWDDDDGCEGLMCLDGCGYGIG